MQHKKAEQYYDMVNSNLSMFLNFNFCCYSSVFFLFTLYPGEKENGGIAAKIEVEEHGEVGIHHVVILLRFFVLHGLVIILETKEGDHLLEVTITRISGIGIHDFLGGG